MFLPAVVFKVMMCSVFFLVNSIDVNELSDNFVYKVTMVF